MPSFFANGVPEYPGMKCPFREKGSVPFYAGSQKSPSRPKPAKIAFISSGRGRLEFSWSRVAYHVVASVQSCSTVTSGRNGTPRAAHQLRACSSDRKNTIFAQVNTMSSHHWAAGTRQRNNHV